MLLVKYPRGCHTFALAMQRVEIVEAVMSEGIKMERQ